MRNVFDCAAVLMRYTRSLVVIFGNDAHVLGMMNAQSGLKPFVYRCINLILSAMQLNYQVSLTSLSVNDFERRSWPFLLLTNHAVSLPAHSPIQTVATHLLLCFL